VNTNDSGILIRLQRCRTATRMGLTYARPMPRPKHDPDQTQPDDFLGELVGSWASAVPVAGPLMAPFAKRAARAAAVELHRARAVTMRAALKSAGMSREALEESIADNPRLVPLLTRVLHEAAMTGQDSILVALGAGFGAAAKDPERIDEVEFRLSIVTSLTSTEAHLLYLVSRIRPREDGSPMAAAEPGYRRWTPAELADRSALRRDLAGIAMERLARQSLVRTIRTGGGRATGWELTELGDEVVELFRTLGERF
jgi:hypothetical protein